LYFIVFFFQILSRKYEFGSHLTGEFVKDYF